MEKIVNIHAAKTNLSRLVEEAANGAPFVIAKAGKPMVKVTAIRKRDLADKRIGFLKGQFKVPDDFDTMGAETILKLMSGNE